MKHSELNPLIDADSLVYRAGFAADAQAKEEFGEKYYREEDCEYVAWALANTRTSMTFILDETFPDRSYYRCFIAGETNYRDEIGDALKVYGPKCADGSEWQYKGNRVGTLKPKYYHEIREYLVDKWKAEETIGCEADDTVAMLQWSKREEESTCIVRQDKDLKMIPGWHFNWVKKEFEHFTLDEANLFFWKQLLEGDRTDHIPGLRGIGPKKADKILEDCGYDLVKIRKECEQRYKREYGNHGLKVMEECADLLWIKRTIHESWRDL